MKCPMCLSDVDENSPAFGLAALRKWVENNGGWSIFESGSRKAGTEFSIEGTPAKVVASKITYDTGDIDRDDYYDELPQGTIFDTYVVIEYAGFFYKKTGTGDSYGNVDWDGDLLPVVPKTKTIQVYEFGE